MAQRIVYIWFPHLLTDWILRKQPALKETAYVLAQNERGRRVVKGVNAIAQQKGVLLNMVVADCRAIIPELEVLNYDPMQPQKLLSALAEWCIRYTPLVGIDLPDGLILDADGCTHLWKGEAGYLKDIELKFKSFGYNVQLSMADTIGMAWAVAHYAEHGTIIKAGSEADTLSRLPAPALRLETAVAERLAKLGLTLVGSFMSMPRTALRRRFGQSLLTRLDQALGAGMELMEPVRPIAPYQERLPSLEPIRTAPGIEVALKTLLDQLCERLNQESKGLRKCCLRCYRVDGIIQTIEIGTNRPSRNVQHLYKLFEIRIPQIEPDLGIELFILEAPVVEELQSKQDALWAASSKSEAAIAELLDRLVSKAGVVSISRYLPAPHHWPERSIKKTTVLTEKPTIEWRTDLPRPAHLLPRPEHIDVSVPMPDYPPLLFKYKGALHTIKKADGPERIEQEWWIEKGAYRDYYCVEDDKGARYWLFRSGDYNSEEVSWFLHGFFT